MIDEVFPHRTSPFCGPEHDLGHGVYAMRVFAILAALLAAACGGGSPTGPSSSIPNVTGNYSGTTTITMPELDLSMSCPTTTVVTQSGSTASIAPMVLRGECGAMSIPLGQVRIDNTGAIDGGSTTGTYTDPSCGVYNYAASGGFFGNELRISVSATSGTCWNINLSAVLRR